MNREEKDGFGERHYRNRVKAEELEVFNVKEGESDLQISAVSDLSSEALKALREVRADLERYITEDHLFAESLEPVSVKRASGIITEMAESAALCGVGPMASVAGAVSSAVGRSLKNKSAELMIENGGDLFLYGRKERIVGIYAGSSPLSWKLGIKIHPGGDEIGVCTSSYSIGHSLSLGKADAAVVVAQSAILADAAATALGNRVKSKEDISEAVEWAITIDGVSGALVVIGPDMGAGGEIEITDI